MKRSLVQDDISLPARDDHTAGVVAALCAIAVGIGLARFAYAPIMPALVAARWTSSAGAAFLGAANFGGYFAGALLSRWFVGRHSPAAVLRGTMLVTTLSLVACAWPLGLPWLTFWRFVAGVGGALLVVIAAPAVLPAIAPARRGRATGIIFLGAGLGIVAASTLMPALLRRGIPSAWLGLGAICALLTGVAWTRWPATWPERLRAAGDADAAEPSPESSATTSRFALHALFAAYALEAIGIAPHAVFFVDYVARGLGDGVAVGSRYWICYGVGAALGPLALGALVDRIGSRRALRFVFALQIVGLALAPAAEHLMWARLVLLGSSATLLGATTPGIVPVALARVRSLAGGARATTAWGTATTGYALFLAVGAYGLSYVFARGAGYAALFWSGAASVAVALGVMVVFDRG